MNKKNISKAELFNFKGKKIKIEKMTKQVKYKIKGLKPSFNPTSYRLIAYIISDYGKKKRERTWLNSQIKTPVKTNLEKHFFELPQSKENQLCLFLLALENKPIVDQYLFATQTRVGNVVLDFSMVGKSVFDSYASNELDDLKFLLVNHLQPKLPVYFQVYPENSDQEQELVDFYMKPHVPFHCLDKEELGFYLAGLLESDGGCNKSDLHISFNRDEMIVAENLIKLFPNGFIALYQNTKNHKGTKFNLNGANMIEFLELIDGKIVHPEQVKQINNCTWLKKNNYQRKHPATEKIKHLAWVSGFFEGDGYLGSRLPKSKTNSYPTPQLTISFSQKDKYVLTLINDFFKDITWSLKKRVRTQTTEHELRISEKKFDAFLPYLTKMNFQGKKHDIVKAFVNLYKLKKVKKPTLQTKKELVGLHQSIKNIRYSELPQVYRYNFSFSSKARTRSTLSLKQMNLLLRLQKKNITISEMVKVLSKEPNIRGIKANSSPTNFPTAAIISHFLQNPNDPMETTKKAEEKQKMELQNFIQKNQRETDGLTEAELKRRLGYAWYSLQYHNIQLEKKILDSKKLTFARVIGIDLKESYRIIYCVR